MKVKKNGQTSKHSAKHGGSKHLISQITKGGIKEAKEQKVQKVQITECKYGINCAHLRAQGTCKSLHKKSHYHFLNLVAPPKCLDSQDQENQKLTKRQKKERKIIDKTIKKEIDVADLDKKQHILKQTEAKNELIGKLDEVQKKVLELVSCSTVSEFFSLLNEVKAQGLDIFEYKRRATIQLKKKNQKLFVEIIDKEYRIAHRLIKAKSKDKETQLFSLYQDINHDTIEPVRQYFEDYFSEDKGIPLAKEENGDKDIDQAIFISTLHLKTFFPQPEQFLSQIYIKLLGQDTLLNIRANIEFFNLMVPLKIHKQMPLVKYYFVDCQTGLSFTKMSQHLSRDHLTTFHAKCKPSPEYAFGQMEQSVVKFTTWVSKIVNKFKSSEATSKIVFLFIHGQKIFPKIDVSEFDQQKLREKKQVLTILKQLFEACFIFIQQKSENNLNQSLQEFFGDQKLKKSSL